MGGRLADIVIEATGRPEAVTEGMMLCRDGGMYVVVGQYTDNGNVALNPHHMINSKHLTIKGCWGSDFSHFYRGVQFMAKHASSLPWDLVVSKVFDLHDAVDALKAVEKLEVFKALLKPWKTWSTHRTPENLTIQGFWWMFWWARILSSTLLCITRCSVAVGYFPLFSICVRVRTLADIEAGSS